MAIRAQLRAATLAAIVRLGPSWAQRQPAGRLVNATGPGLEGMDGYLTRALPAVNHPGISGPDIGPVSRRRRRRLS